MSYLWVALASALIVGVLLLAAALFPHPRDWRKDEFEHQLREASNRESSAE